MNQKKVYMIFIFVLILFPMMTLAKDTCNSNDIKIKSIDLKESNCFSEEVEEANINNNIINLNLEMYNVGESITYKIKVKNNSNNDYYFTKDSFNLNTDHIEYEILNNSAVIKPNEEKEIELKITYKNKTPEDEFNENNMMSITLSATPLSNPSTKRSLILILLIVGTTTILAFVGEKKLIEKFMIVIFVILTVPLITHALCTINLEINANITINEKEAIFLPGTEVNVRMKELAGDDTSTAPTSPHYFEDINITTIKYSRIKPNESDKEEKNIVSASDSSTPIYMWYEEGTIYWWSESKYPKLNENASWMFCRLTELNDITDFFRFDTTITKNINFFLYEDINLKTLNGLETWDISKINYMDSAFKGMIALSSIESLNNWDTSSVTNMTSLFQSDKALTSLEALKNWNIVNVRSLYNIFLGTSLMNLKGLENWNTSNVTNMTATFQEIPSLVEASAISRWDVSNVLYFNRMFRGDKNITDIASINNWNIQETANFTYMFQNAVTPPEFTKVSGTWNSAGTFIPTP